MNRTKLYWWIPVIGLFFIEEMTEWLYDAKTTEENKDRQNYYALIWAMNLILVPLMFYIFTHI